MSPITKQFLDKQFLLNLVMRQKTQLIGAVVAGLVISMISYKVMPRKYKVQTVIGIQTQYFQVPLIRDFMPETWDGSELKSQREAIIRRALSFNYLKELAAKHNLFKGANPEDLSTYELQELSKRFEVIPAGSSSFIVSFFARDPEMGYRVIRDSITHIRAMLAEERLAVLMKLHDAIRERLESLSFGKAANNSPIMANRPDLVKGEMDKIEEEIRVLKTTYSDKHPRIAELTKRYGELSAWMKLNPEVKVPTSMPRAANFSSAKVDEGSKELFQDLLKKFHYLEVVIFMDQQNQNAYLTLLQEPFVPKSPVWPKLPILMIWGVAMGFLVGTLLVLGGEVARQRKLLEPTSSTNGNAAGGLGSPVRS